MTKNIVAIVMAIFAGGVLVFSIDGLGHLIYQVPSGLDPERPETISEYVKSMPVGPLIFIALSQAAGAFSGGFVGTIISRRRRVALIYGVIALVFGATNLIAVPHPVWLAVLLIILPIPSALLGGSAALFLQGERPG